MKISTLAIANRGEVAVRIIRACQEMGIRTVLLHSEPDRNTVAYRIADERYCVGPAPTAESYLNIDANIHGAIKTGAQAIHPGFGFLSENENFAKACAQYKLIFVGPSPQAIRSMGDKVEAKEIARRANVPVIPGFEGDVSDLKTAAAACLKIGYPVIVKAAGGGGGRGLKLARSEKELEEALQSAAREAASSFGDSRVFIEKYLERAKHIEIQIFGDAQGNIHAFGERECSVQRRHQKMIEEAPSARLNIETRRQMEETAKRLAKAVKYQGAGTVEFLLEDKHFYFMEMNTRLQVEHPVTEMVYNIDLVKAQISTAQGDIVPFDLQISPRGHSIECRLYAEDPFAEGRPSTGRLLHVEFPQGAGRRFEMGFESGDDITAHYDPMIAKIIVWDETRERAVRKMLRTLDDTLVFGVRTNIPLLRGILKHPEFVSGEYSTQFMSTFFSGSLKEDTLADWEENLIDVAKREALNEPVLSGDTVQTQPVWVGSWRNV